MNNYVIVVEAGDHFVNCTVRKMGTNNTCYTTTIPLEELMGSRFGSCSCGVPKVMGIPCEHMVAVLKSGLVEGYDENNVMPVWWTTTTLKRQFPLDVKLGPKMDMDWLKTKGIPDSDIRHCPGMAAPNKAGHPKKAARIKGPLEAGKKRKRG